MEESSQKAAQPSGQTTNYAVPDDAFDCGDGFYIEVSTEPGIGEVRYRACMPNCSIGRYANDLWQAQIYIEHMKAARFG